MEFNLLCNLHVALQGKPLALHINYNLFSLLQVLALFKINTVIMIIYYMQPPPRQLSGRAGRNGHPAECVLFTNRSEIKSNKDVNMINFCSDKKSCRRRILLESIGDHQSISTPRNMCCDVCTHSRPYPHLKFIDPIKQPPKRKQRPIREVPEGILTEVHNRLREAQLAMFSQSMGMRALSLNAVCPISCIDEICKKANIIKSMDDLNVIAGLRVKFAEKFFKIFIEIINTYCQ